MLIWTLTPGPTGLKSGPASQVRMAVHVDNYLSPVRKPDLISLWSAMISINHRLRGSASTVLTATALVNGECQNSTPYRTETP